MADTITVKTPADLKDLVIPANHTVEIKDAKGELVGHRDVSRPVDQKATSWVTQFADGYLFPLVIEFIEHLEAMAAPSQSEEA